MSTACSSHGGDSLRVAAEAGKGIVFTWEAGLGQAIELGGLAMLAGALLMFVLPETKQAPLPD